MVKDYHGCLFSVEVGEKFWVRKKKDECGNVLRMVNDHGQLSHLERELVFHYFCLLYSLFAISSVESSFLVVDVNYSVCKHKC